MHTKQHVLLAGIGLLFPSIALANFFWPPALYYYGAMVWWSIPVGLTIEFIGLSLCINLPRSRLFYCVIVVNLASAIIGFAASWPLVHWSLGIDTLISLVRDLPTWTHVLMVTFPIILIFAINVGIERYVALRWFRVAGSLRVTLGFILVNAISMFMLFYAGGIFDSI